MLKIQSFSSWHYHKTLNILYKPSINHPLITFPSRKPRTIYKKKKKKKKDHKQRESNNLLEKWKGERTPELSLAAQPKALCGCSSSGDFAILSAFHFLDEFKLSAEQQPSDRVCIYIKSWLKVWLSCFLKYILLVNILK